MLKGIDVSYANGHINWDKVKGNVDYAILRLGYGSDKTSQDDTRWARNVAECNRLSIPWGVYLYSYAMTTAEAESEADHALRLLKGLKPTYPVYIDMEDADGYKAKRGGVSKRTATDICRIFCERITAAGFTAGVYANKDWAVNHLLMDELAPYTFWLAQYNSKVTYAGKYDMWQYTSDGTVPGIKGRVDLNYCYKDFGAKAPAVRADTSGTVTIPKGKYYQLRTFSAAGARVVAGNPANVVVVPRNVARGANGAEDWYIVPIGDKGSSTGIYISNIGEKSGQQCCVVKIG